VSFDPSATAALKRASPFWAWVRSTLTLPIAIGMLVACLGVLVTALVEFRNLRNDVTELAKSFKVAEGQGERIAALQQRIDDLAEQVQEQQRRWDRVERAADMPIRRRR
jgi:predicted signal transduction protein with EAL and GGDEF domain